VASIPPNVLQFRLMRLLFIAIFTYISLSTFAQGHQPVFPELTGEELIDEVRQAFKSQTVLTYAQARDTLWSKIVNKNDSLTCLYTSYTIYLDPEKNPRTDAFEKGINAEHIWPRSKGASGTTPTADMHHILPCREDVNNDRGNLPFEELSVAATRFWYFQDIKQNFAPTQDIELYSQLGQQSFTPPVHMRGDIARSMLYFYTMYTQEALQADPEYFEFQRLTFCKWHFDDPVDEEEWQKTMMIAPYQESKANPFILDCTLPERTYCQDYSQNCTPLISSVQNEEPGIYWSVYPNPTNAAAGNLELTLPYSSPLEINIFDQLGKPVFHHRLQDLNEGTHLISLPEYWSKESMVPGFYILQVRINGTHKPIVLTRKLILN